MKQLIVLAVLGILFVNQGATMEVTEKTEIEILSLDVISYEDFVNEDSTAMNVLKRAMYEKGIVGIKGIPGYREKLLKFIETAREFSALPEEIKEAYSPHRSIGETMGYERGRERFKRPDGRWVVDDLKVSYYGLVPDQSLNRWPVEMDLKTPFQELGAIMSEMGEAVMKKIELIGPKTGLSLGDAKVGRMLYYCKGSNNENPFWCGAHFDHGMLTALLPAFYFVNGEAVPEPMEAGLFVKTTFEGVFKKVVADDPEVLLFQVGEFGQLATNDAIRATEHRVHKPLSDCIERYTMALFFNVPMETVLHSSSELSKDSRYGEIAGGPCTFRRWNDESLKRYLVEN
ncbi:MAG TPA: hypothetical protein VLE96_06535 [Chlamydiales bacterium]|nr:hypothetical protein [Chlamydiales bacterium]